MSADQEPKPSEENNTYPPFLTKDQLQLLGNSFTYDNFNVVTPPIGEPYLVITVPESGQLLVDKAFTKAQEAAFNKTKEVGTDISASDLPEDARAESTAVWSELYLPTLKGVDLIYFTVTLHSILLSAEFGAQLNALRSISETTDTREQEIAMRELDKKQALISDFTHSKAERYMFYNGDKLIYKTPADLENPYPPSHIGRQN